MGLKTGQGISNWVTGEEFIETSDIRCRTRQGSPKVLLGMSGRPKHQTWKEGQKLPFQDLKIQLKDRGTWTPNQGGGCSRGAILCIFTLEDAG